MVRAWMVFLNFFQKEDKEMTELLRFVETHRQEGIEITKEELCCWQPGVTVNLPGQYPPDYFSCTLSSSKLRGPSHWTSRPSNSSSTQLTPETFVDEHGLPNTNIIRSCQQHEVNFSQSSTLTELMKADRWDIP